MFVRQICGRRVVQSTNSDIKANRDHPEVEWRGRSNKDPVHVDLSWHMDWLGRLEVSLMVSMMPIHHNEPISVFLFRLCYFIIFPASDTPRLRQNITRESALRRSFATCAGHAQACHTEESVANKKSARNRNHCTRLTGSSSISILISRIPGVEASRHCVMIHGTEHTGSGQRQNYGQTSRKCFLFWLCQAHRNTLH